MSEVISKKKSVKSNAESAAAVSVDLEGARGRGSANHSHSSNSPNSGGRETFEFHFFDYVQFLLSKRRFIVVLSFIFFVCMLFWGYVINKPIYKSDAFLTVNLASKSQAFSLSRFTNWVEEQEVLNKVYLIEQLFDSSEFRRRLTGKLKGDVHCEESEDQGECESALASLRRHFKVTESTDMEELGEKMSSHLSIFSDATKYSLSVVVHTSSSEASQALAFLAVTTLVDLNYENLLKKNAKLRTFLQEQTENTRAELEKFERQLVDLQTKHRMIATPEIEAKITSSFLDSQDKVEAIGREVLALDILIRDLESDLTKFRTSLANHDKPSYMFLMQAQRQFDLLRFKSEWTNKNLRPRGAAEPADERAIEDFKNILTDVTGTAYVATDPWDHVKRAEALLIETRQRRDKLSSELRAGSQALGKQTKDFVKIPEIIRKLSEIKRSIHLTTELYSLLKTRLQETIIQDAERPNDLTILSLPERAATPAGISSSKKLMLAVLGGPLLSAVLLFINFVLVPLVHGPRDLENIGIKVLGKILRVSTGHFLSSDNHSVFIREHSHSYEANSIRFLRLKIDQMLARKKKTKNKGLSVAVTGVNSGDGVTFNVVNLAEALAMAKYGVAIVDVRESPGGVNKYYEGMAGDHDETPIDDDWGFIVKRSLASGVNIVSFRLSGIDSADYFESKSFRSLHEDLIELYDLVLIDCPSIDGNVEPLLISTISDLVLVVVSQGETILDEAKEAFASICETAKGQVFGVVNFAIDGFAVLRRRRGSVVDLLKFGSIKRGKQKKRAA